MNEWYDIPSEEMTLEQARSAVRELRKKVAEQFANMQNEWISVKDRLPKPRQIVLMYIKSKEKNTEDVYDVGFLNSIDLRWHTADLYNDIDYREEVTHWMPLPQKPESEDDDIND